MLFIGEKQPHPGLLQDENVESNWPTVRLQTAWNVALRVSAHDDFQDEAVIEEQLKRFWPDITGTMGLIHRGVP